jgi:hypothetical protein
MVLQSRTPDVRRTGPGVTAGTAGDSGMLERVEEKAMPSRHHSKGTDNSMAMVIAIPRVAIPVQHSHNQNFHHSDESCYCILVFVRLYFLMYLFAFLL